MKEDRGLQLKPLLKPRSYLSRDWFSNKTVQCFTCRIEERESDREEYFKEEK